MKQTTSEKAVEAYPFSANPFKVRQQFPIAKTAEGWIMYEANCRPEIDTFFNNCKITNIMNMNNIRFFTFN